METQYVRNHICSLVPHAKPFRYIGDITYLDAERITGTYYLSQAEPFYAGHFPNYPVTPGVILTEVMAQIGMVAFGIYLLTLEGEKSFANMVTLLTDVQIKYKQEVMPNTKVVVHSQKLLFRHGRLKCNVTLYNEQQQVCCIASMSGMVAIRK